MRLSDNVGVENLRASWMLWLVAWTLMFSGAARAQFRLDIEQVADRAFDQLDIGELVLKEGGRVVLRAPNVQQRVVGGRIVNLNRGGAAVVVDANMERFVFREHRSEAATRAHLTKELATAIRQVGETTRLTPAQKKKLQLAGEGDIALLMAEANRFRAEFEGAAMQGRNQLVQLLQEAQPLQKKMRAKLFGTGSIFDRVLAGMEEAKQSRRFENAKVKVLEDFYRGAMKHAISKFEQSQPLKPAQREQIMESMLGESRLTKIDFSLLRGTKHLLEFAMFQLAKERAMLAEILEEKQLKKLEPMLQDAIAMEDTLRNAGYLR